MTTLLQRCKNLDAKLKDLALAKRNADDMRHIEQRTREWKERNAKLKGLMAQTQALKMAAEDSKSVASKRMALRQSAGKVLARLTNDDGIKEITRDAAWTRLLKTSEGLAEELETAGHNAWRAHLEQQGTLENPAALRLRTPPTPQNEEALRAYQASHEAYAAIARLRLPRTPENLTQLETYVVACRQAFERLEFNLPAEVKRFYEAIIAGTATLTQVTPSVLEWLAKHGHLEQFRVRSGGQ